MLVDVHTFQISSFSELLQRENGELDSCLSRQARILLYNYKIFTFSEKICFFTIF
jgi:hypothetical protein